MPRYNETVDFIVVQIPMSDFQFGIYERPEQAEEKTESQNAKRQKKQISSDYLKSRLLPIVFSSGHSVISFSRPEITRPLLIT